MNAVASVSVVLDLRDLGVPVVGAPMAGGPSTPALASAVSAAGGLGFLAAGYKSAEQVATEMVQTRRSTSAAIGLNLFVVGSYDPGPEVLDAYRQSLVPDAQRLGVELGEPRWDDDEWQPKLELVLDVRPEVVSFTFGCPSEDVLRRLRQSQVHASVTVTTVAESREAAQRGAASLCVQGPEAGGHRGLWDPVAAPERTPLLDLLDEVLAAVDLPVVAGGGLIDAAGVDAVVRRGAVAGQVGTAYLLADEAGTNPLHRSALASGSFTRTDVTRAFTGRWARGLANGFMAAHEDAPAGYPQLHHLTSPLRAAAVAAGDVDTAHFWAGTGFREIRTAPAQEITRSLTP